MTPQEALDHIAALCEAHERRWKGLIGSDAAAFTAPQLKRILADVEPEQGITLTAEEASRVLDWSDEADYRTGSTTADRDLVAKLGGDA